MATTTTTEKNKRIARHLVDALNERDFGGIDEVFADDVIDHTPLGETRGREAVRELSETLHGAFSGFTVTAEELVAEGDTVVLRGTERGTHEGEFMGISPTGREFEIGLMSLLRVEDGRIVERWVQPDVLGLMQQLGAVESPAE